jgi:hypothetical protein
MLPGHTSYLRPGKVYLIRENSKFVNRLINVKDEPIDPPRLSILFLVQLLNN